MGRLQQYLLQLWARNMIQIHAKKQRKRVMFLKNFLRNPDYLAKPQIDFILNQYVSLIIITNHDSFPWIPGRTEWSGEEKLSISPCSQVILRFFAWDRVRQSVFKFPEHPKLTLAQPCIPPSFSSLICEIRIMIVHIIPLSKHKVFPKSLLCATPQNTAKNWKITNMRSLL